MEEASSGHAGSGLRPLPMSARGEGGERQNGRRRDYGQKDYGQKNGRRKSLGQKDGRRRDFGAKLSGRYRESSPDGGEAHSPLTLFSRSSAPNLSAPNFPARRLSAFSVSSMLLDKVSHDADPLWRGAGGDLVSGVGDEA